MIDTTGVLLNDPEFEKTKNTIDIYNCTTMSEESKGSYAVTLTLDDTNRKKSKILIPYAQRAEQKKWLDAINILFIKGRVQYMSLEQNTGEI